MANVNAINFLYFKSYNGKEIWEPVMGFEVSNHLKFKTVRGGVFKSTRIESIYYDCWNYELIVDTRSGSEYRFALVAPYGKADYEVADAIMFQLVEKVEAELPDSD